MTDLLWPAYDGPGDLAAIEEVPLADRGLPATTYHVVTRAAATRGDRPATSCLTDATHWQTPSVQAACTPNWPTASSRSSSPAPTTRTPPLQPWTHTPSPGDSTDHPPRQQHDNAYDRPTNSKTAAASTQTTGPPPRPRAHDSWLCREFVIW